jgi:FtsH-binding integral membrane protein
MEPATYRRPSFRIEAVDTDAGLRSHMLGIYRNMALGLSLTGLVALGVATTPSLYEPIFNTPLKWAAIFAPLAFVLFFSFRVEKMTTAGARTAFFAFAGIMGVSMASIFLVYTGTSIATAFLMAAALFAGLSLWGYTTSRDLSRTSTFLLVGLVAVIGASLVNLFIGSTMFQTILSIVWILLFLGLTAWDTQRLKSEYLAYADTQAAEKLAAMGALSLYLNIINLFQMLLYLTGQRQQN